MNYNSNEIKITVVGDGMVGKTSLLWSYVKGKLPRNYIPTVFEGHTTNVNFDGEQYSLQLCDTAGQEGWDTLRILAYPSTDVILICFSITMRSSLTNARDVWFQEVRQNLPRVPIILVGTMCDLRNTTGQEYTMSDWNKNTGDLVSYEEGDKVKQEIHAFKYIECSALMKTNVNEVFRQCIAAYKNRNAPIHTHKNFCCDIL